MHSGGVDPSKIRSGVNGCGGIPEAHLLRSLSLGNQRCCHRCCPTKERGVDARSFTSRADDGGQEFLILEMRLPKYNSATTRVLDAMACYIRKAPSWTLANAASIMCAPPSNIRPTSIQVRGDKIRDVACGGVVCSYRDTRTGTGGCAM
jgi:hypothetical protein